jgi:hypothetical protein
MRTLLLTAAAIALAASPAFARNPTAQERADIENLAYRYIFALDWRDVETYANTFAPDGVLNYGGGQAVGRDAIRAVVQPIRDREMAAAREAEAAKQAELGDDYVAPPSEDAVGQGSAHGQHFVTAMVIDVAEDGNTAVAQAYWAHMAGAEPRMNSYGHYVDRLVKIDGEWLYSSRRTYNEQADGRETFPFINPVTNPEQYGAELE